MTDIKPFYHIKNFKDGVSDAISKGVFDTAPRSPEYKDGTPETDFKEDSFKITIPVGKEPDTLYPAITNRNELYS